MRANGAGSLLAWRCVMNCKLAVRAMVLAGLFTSKVAAQVHVTPTVMPTPPGQLIVVNNGPGDQTQPHVDGDLVCYTDQQGGAATTIRYFSLTTQAGGMVPVANDGSADFLCDVRRTTIVFTRSLSSARILEFDVGAGGQPVEIVPTTGSPMRFGAQIGDQAIIWEDFVPATTASAIVAYDRTNARTTVLSPSSPPVNQNPGISPDGSVVVWEGCVNVQQSSCLIWKAARSSVGMWTPQQLVSQIGGVQIHPDTDGTMIVYDSLPSLSSSTAQIVWQPVAGGTEQLLNLPGSAINPSLSGGLIAFSYDATGSGSNQIALYDTASNVLYNLTADRIPGDTHNKVLPDISMTPDGKVRVVWQVLENDENVYAYTFNLPVGDFSLSAISPMTISAGGSGSTNVTVNPMNGFSSAVNLSVTGQPAGVTALPSPSQVTPSGGIPASSVLNVSLPSFITPTNFTLTVTGTAGALSHSASAEVTVTATESSIGNLIGDLLGAGCIDNAGLGNAMTSKLAAAQSASNAQTAINTLTALKNQINAQAGKHIATSCTIGGVTFNPVTALLLDVQALIDSLRVGTIADPITGYVVDRSGVGVPGATVSILDAGGSPVATATTDITGFYFFATTNVLAQGSSYTVAVTGLPAGFGTFPAASPAFIWAGTTGMMIGNFVLN
jgi:hypothetical protein